MAIDVSKLTAELSAILPDLAGVSSAGRIDTLPGMVWFDIAPPRSIIDAGPLTTEEQNVVQAALTAHDPDTPLWSEVYAERDERLAVAQARQGYPGLDPAVVALWAEYAEAVVAAVERAPETGAVVWATAPTAQDEKLAILKSKRPVVGGWARAKYEE